MNVLISGHSLILQLWWWCPVYRFISCAAFSTTREKHARNHRLTLGDKISTSFLRSLDESCRLSEPWTPEFIYSAGLTRNREPLLMRY